MFTYIKLYFIYKLIFNNNIVINDTIDNIYYINVIYHLRKIFIIILIHYDIIKIKFLNSISVIVYKYIYVEVMKC